MDKALLDGKTVNAEWAAKLPDDVLAKIRPRFKCLGCNADAYLNKGSWRQAAHFAARNHAEECEAAYQGENGSDAKLIEAHTVVIAIGSVGPRFDDGRPAEKAGKSGRRTTLSGANGPAETQARRGVRGVLNELIIDPAFATSPKEIVVGKQRTLASEFFVPFSQLSEQHANRLIGVWGSVFSSKEGGAIAWLNRGDAKPTIEVPVPMFNDLKRQYRFANAAELKGASFLLIGTFDTDLKCRIEDTKQIALRINKEND